MKLTLNAKRLRIILMVGILLVTIGAVGGFMLARNRLQTFATSISQMEADASSVDSNIEALKKLQVTLKGTEDIKAKLNSITVPTSEYPVSVIANVTSIAKRSGIKLTSINYGEATDTKKATPQAGTLGATAAPQPAPEAATPSGVTKKTVTAVVESPVDYTAFMNFIKGIETDTMYMHITRITLTKAEGKTVTVQPLTIEVYTK